MAELRPYTPTWRDTVASWMMGQGQSSPERRAFVGGLLGSTGLGNTGVGVVDATPVGGLLSLQEASQAGDKTGMALASAGLIPGAGVAEKVAAKVAERSAPAAEKFITAYHGSPHSFDKFSLDKIGTGEGNQVYGHGLYFAENEGVAKSYRDALSRQVSVDGKPVSSMHPSDSPYAAAIHSVSGLIADGLSPEVAIAKETEKWRKSADPYIKFANENPQHAERANRQANNFIDIANHIEKLDPSSLYKNPGHMYQVRINADPEQFFDWDKPLSEQSQSIQDALKQLSNNPKNGFNLIDSIATLDAAKADPRLSHLTKRGSPVNPTGNSIYENLANERGAVDWPITADADMRKEYRNKASVLTSQDMRNAGIPGIKYLDQGSRSEGVGSHNYVVFDDSLIDILKKYGLVGLLGGGAAMGASQQQQQGVPSL